MSRDMFDTGEVQRDGLASVLEEGCDSCDNTSLETSQKMKHLQK